MAGENWLTKLAVRHNMMKLAWLYWEPEWSDEDDDGQPTSGHWVFKEVRDDWRHGKWKRIVYCEVEE